MSWRRSRGLGVVAPLALVAVAVAGCGGDDAPKPAPGESNLGRPAGGYVPVVDPMIQHDVSPPLRETAVPPDPDAREGTDEHDHNTDPLPNIRDVPGQTDSVVQMAAPGPAAPTSGMGFDGVGQGFTGPSGTFTVSSAPPDPDLAVGPNHIVQIVNSAIAIFSKTGTPLLGPAATNSLWAGFGGGCQNNDDGDGIVVYDQLANRFIISQFSVTTTPYLECVAVSTGPDPTGTWSRYSFPMTNFPDYPKMAVWPDGYYTTFNTFRGKTFQGAAVCAYDRAKMLAGQAATQVCFTGDKTVASLLPSNLDGQTLPPAGSPNYLLNITTNAVNLWKVHIDWAHPTTGSTVTGSIPVSGVSPFNPACNGGSCIPQPTNLSQALDSLGTRLMYRLAYRNFGDHEALVVNHSVATASSVGVRWYEIRNPSAPAVFQQGTYAPDDTYRWMGSAAMDRNGDLAIGYSASSASVNPSIRYTGRIPTDPAGQLQGETTLIAGTGYQEKTLNRWGDYSSLVVDPSDDCTFWYTNEYLAENGKFNWHTRIGSFRFASCMAPGADGGTDGGSDASSDTKVDASLESGSDAPSDTASDAMADGAAGTGGAGTGGAGTGAAGTGSAGTGAAGAGGAGAGGTGADAAAGSDAGTSDGGVVDVPAEAAPPSPPTALNAAVLDRRNVSVQLSWTAPATSGGGTVSGYQIRYAKVPITAQNFDDSSVATAYPFTGTPKAPGQADGIAVKGLYIESDYYFAVASVDAGTRSATIAATSAAVTAHFSVTSLSGVGGATEQFGFQFESSGDVNGDGVSDLLVGAFSGARAYLYLGNLGPSGVAPTAVTTTFTAGYTPTSFGRGVAIIGDVDRDGLDDLAISDRLFTSVAAPSRVFIFKGRATWPATLTAADANYVISTDSAYSNNALFGSVIARLGDFNNDGSPDFAVGSQFFGTGTTQTGRVVVVLGKTGFGSIQLPDTTNTITVDGDPALTTPWFGYRIVGLGHFYAGGTTMIVGAPGTSAGTAGSEGHLYAFRGQSGTGGAIAIGSADAVVVGNALKTRLGGVLANLGPLFSALPSVGSGSPTDRSVLTGSAWLFSGDTTTGPFASHVVLHQPVSPTTNNGEAVIAGGVSGIDKVFSLIGDGAPDVLEVPQSGNTFTIIDGKTFAGPALASPVDATAIGAVTIPFPASWGATVEGGGRLLPDINGDTYPDFAISNASGAVPGSVVIYW